MNEVLCEMCGLRNRPEAATCARCKEPLEIETRITPSPFAQAASRTTEKTVVAPRDAGNTPVGPSIGRSVSQETTRVIAGDLDIPLEARAEPQFAPRARTEPAAPARGAPARPQGLPTLRSRVPTQPLPADDLRARAARPEAKPPAARPARPEPAAPVHDQLLTAELHPPADLPRTILMDLDGLAPTAPAPGAAKVPLRDRLAAAAATQEPTTVGAPQWAPSSAQNLSRARWHHHLAANAIDGAVALALTLAIAAVCIALGHHSYPQTRPTAFENLGLWLARSGSQPLRTGLIAATALTAYGVAGALRGATVGRAVMGLVLVARDGRTVPWSGALWHGLGCSLNIITLGAGSLWCVVDRWHRSWACLLSRTQVVPRHQVVPR